MGKVQDDILIGVGRQTAQGTINADVRDATSVGTTLAPGVALGVRTRKDSIGFGLERIEAEQPEIPGTLTRTPGYLERVDVGTLNFATDWKGGGAIAPAPGELEFAEAIHELMFGLGYQALVSTGVQADYTPTSEGYLTVKLWRGGASYVFSDVQVERLEVAFEGGGIPVATWSLNPPGVDQVIEEAFPTVAAADFGTQFSLPAPTLKSAAATIDGIVRGFVTGTLTLENVLADFGDSNTVTGRAVERDGRTARFAGRFYVDDSNEIQDFTNLSALGGDGTFTFSLGPLVSGIGAQNIQHTLRNMDYTSMSLDNETGRVVWDVDGYATGTAGDDEVEIQLLP